MKLEIPGPLFLLLLLAAAVALAQPLAAEDDAAAATVVWTGKVTDGDGNPVAEAEVVLVPASFRGTRISAVTDAEGSYRFSHVVPASYRLRVTGSGLAMRSIDAIAFPADGATAAWELEGPVNPTLLPSVDYAAGQQVRFDVVLHAADAPLIEPADYRGTIDRATELVQQGRCEPAIAVLEDHLTGFPHRARGHYLLGYCRASLGRTEQGAAALERSLELSPGLAGAALLLGQVLLQAGQGERAATWLRKEAEEGRDPRLRVEAWIALGFLERDAGNAEAAIEAFEQARGLDPERPEPWAELPNLHAGGDDPGRVLDVLAAAREAGRKAPLRPLLNLVIGRMNDKRYDEASGLLDRAMAVAADDEQRAMVHALIGRCRLGQQKQSEGIAALRKSLELDGDGPFAGECRKILADLGT